MKLEYNDNPRLINGGGEADWIRSLLAAADLTSAGPRSSLSLDPSVNARRYENDTALDSNDYSLSLAAQRDYEGAAAQLTAGYSRAAVQSDQFDGLGVIQVGESEERWNVGPSWTVDLGPLWSATANAAYSSDSFDSRVPTQADYSVVSASISLARELSDDERLSLTLSADRLDTPSIDNRVDQAGFQLSYTRSLSESLTASGSLGVQRNRFEQGSLPVKSRSGILLDLTVKSEREYGTWQFDVNRSVDPSGTGTVMRSDTATASLSHQWSPAWSGNVMILISDRKDLQGLDPANDSVYVHGQAGVAWQVAEDWQLSAEYRIVRQRLRFAGAATGNEALLWLSYRADLWAPASAGQGSGD